MNDWALRMHTCACMCVCARERASVDAHVSLRVLSEGHDLRRAAHLLVCEVVRVKVPHPRAFRFDGGEAARAAKAHAQPKIRAAALRHTTPSAKAEAHARVAAAVRCVCARARRRLRRRHLRLRRGEVELVEVVVVIAWGGKHRPVRERREATIGAAVAVLKVVAAAVVHGRCATVRAQD